MREILFRAKRVDNGEWVEGYFIKDDTTGQTFIHAQGNSVNESQKIGEEGCLRLVAFEINPQTLRQYTGLMDENGRKIWENDILVEKYKSIIYHTSKVIWDMKECAWMCASTYGSIYKMNTIDLTGYEKIGNIFDNPELLEED